MWQPLTLSNSQKLVIIFNTHFFIILSLLSILANHVDVDGFNKQQEE